MRISCLSSDFTQAPLKPNSPNIREVPSLRFAHEENEFRSPAQYKLNYASSTDD